MKPFAVGVPTCTRYDLCDEFIASVLANSVVPENIVVIDNGGTYTPKHSAVELHRQLDNIGIAKSWNLIHRLTVPLDLIICNDDLKLGRDVLENLLNSNTLFTEAAGMGWSCFKQDQSLWDTIGDYDETFFAYHEDNDYSRRLKLAGIQRGVSPHCGIVHHGSATVKAMIGHNRSMFHHRWLAGSAYYKEKWGGPPDLETFMTPFNK